LKIEVKLLLSANRKSYMPCRLAQQRMTLCDLESALCAISAVAELLVSCFYFMPSSPLEWCLMHHVFMLSVRLPEHMSQKFSSVANITYGVTTRWVTVCLWTHCTICSNSKRVCCPLASDVESWTHWTILLLPVPDVSNRARNVVHSRACRPLASDVEICNVVNSKFEIGCAWKIMKFLLARNFFSYSRNLFETRQDWDSLTSLVS